MNGRVDRIDWVRSRCRLLESVGDELEESKPFAGTKVEVRLP